MKYEINHTCGHTEIHNIGGKKTERERELYVVNHSKCTECTNNMHKKQAEIAATQAKEAGWPDLQGSEKQVIWAEQLRSIFVRNVDEWAKNQNAKLEAKAKESDDGVLRAQIDAYNNNIAIVFDHIMTNKRKASWWIDERSTSVLRLMDREANTLNPDIFTKPDNTTVKASTEAMSEAVVTPNEQKHSGAVEISPTENEVVVKYIKNEEFRLLVKGLGYSWNADEKAWIMKCNEFTGTAKDRAAELGNELLRSGFAIRIYDDELREKAVAADYAPSSSRWIKFYVSGEYAGWLCIGWKERDQKIYDAARRIKGSRWNKPNVCVPMDCCDEVLDFADIMGFAISAKAQNEIEAYKKSRIIVTPKVPALTSQDDKLQRILESDRGIIDDLKD